MKNRFPFTCGICIRPAHPHRDSCRELVEHLHKRLAREGFLFFWNLPRTVHIPEIEERNRLSQGKYALPHALLRREEIEEELLFSSAGTENNVHEYVFPPCPAPFRRAAGRIYRERGRILLEDREILYHIDSRGMHGLPLLRINTAASYPSLKKRMKQLRRLGQSEESPVFVILDTCARETAEDTVSILVRLRRKFCFETLELDDLLKAIGRGRSSEISAENIVPVPRPDHILPADPGSRYRREITWDTPKETRRILLARAFNSEDTTEKQEYGSFQVPDRGMIAHMPGEVEMEEEEISAFFRQGELAGLSRSGTSEFISTPASAWIETEKNRVRARNIGSFSFQNSAIRGLRDSCVLESEEFAEPGRLVRDYFFTTGDKRLCISFFFFFPGCRPGVEIRSYGICEIPLQRFEGHPLVEVHYPGEEASTVPIDDVSGGLLHGTAFSFTGQSTVLNLLFADYQSKVRELPFSVRDGVLCINPGGSYHGFQGDTAKGLSERFSIVLNLDSLSPEKASLQSLASLRPHLESHQLCFSPNIPGKARKR